MKGRTTTHIYGLVDSRHHWHKAVNEGQSVRTVFIDFALPKRSSRSITSLNILIANLMEFGLPDVIIH